MSQFELIAGGQEAAIGTELDRVDNPPMPDRANLFARFDIEDARVLILFPTVVVFTPRREVTTLRTKRERPDFFRFRKGNFEKRAPRLEIPDRHLGIGAA